MGLRVKLKPQGREFQYKVTDDQTIKIRVVKTTPGSATLELENSKVEKKARNWLWWCLWKFD
jgi:hypothetical protein